MILESDFSHLPHEYLRDTLEMKYRRCVSCGSRTEFTCVECGFCWSCHWKMEQVEKFELLYRSFKGGKVPSPTSDPGAREKGRQERPPEITDNFLSTARAVNVFGIRSEPICDYQRCHHEFSLHGNRSSKCKCKHPRNAAIGA
jgi:hypothetical protein